MLDWSVDQNKHPVLILMPGNEVTDRSADKEYGNVKYKVEQSGEKVAILALGDFYQRGEILAKEIESKFGFKPTLVNPRFANGLDNELLISLADSHNIIVTLEDGILDGGFGEKVASFLGMKDVKVKNYGLNREFYDRYDPEELLDELGITTEKIIEDIKGLI